MSPRHDPRRERIRYAISHRGRALRYRAHREVLTVSFSVVSDQRHDGERDEGVEGGGDDCGNGDHLEWRLADIPRSPADGNSP